MGIETGPNPSELSSLQSDIGTWESEPVEKDFDSLASYLSYKFPKINFSRINLKYRKGQSEPSDIINPNSFSLKKGMTLFFEKKKGIVLVSIPVPKVEVKKMIVPPIINEHIEKPIEMEFIVNKEQSLSDFLQNHNIDFQVDIFQNMGNNSSRFIARNSSYIMLTRGTRLVFNKEKNKVEIFLHSIPLVEEEVRGLDNVDFNKFRAAFLMDEPMPFGFENINELLFNLKKININPKHIVYLKNPKKDEVGESHWEAFGENSTRIIPVGIKLTYNSEGTLFVSFPFNPMEKLTVSSKESYKVKAGDTLYNIFKNNLKKYFPHGANLGNITILFKEFESDIPYYISSSSVGQVLKPNQIVYIKNGEIYIEEFIGSKKKIKKETVVELVPQEIEKDSLPKKVETIADPSLAIIPNTREDQIRKTLELSRNVITGLSPEAYNELKKALTILLGDKDMDIKDFDKECTKLRKKVTRTMWEILSDKEFKIRFKKLRKEFGGRRDAALMIAKNIGITAGIVRRDEANPNFKEYYRSTIAEASKLNPSIPIEWIEEIIYVESKGSAMAVSPDGAFGIMQMLHYGFEKNSYFSSMINPFNPQTNILRATEFLALLKRKARHDLKILGLTNKINLKDITFHYYNRGETFVRKWLKKKGAQYTEKIGDEARNYTKSAKVFRAKQKALLAQK